MYDPREDPYFFRRDFTSLPRTCELDGQKPCNFIGKFAFDIMYFVWQGSLISYITPFFSDLFVTDVQLHLD